MVFFRKIFEFNDARMDSALPFLKLRSTLLSVFSRREVGDLIQKYVLKKRGVIFASSKTKFNPLKLTPVFNDSLMVIGFLQAGVIHTGFCLIWRALLKYWEKLSAEPEFYKTRGKLLENYCYDIIHQLGIECNKIYIRNTSKPEDARYKEMLLQTSEFPVAPIRLEFDLSSFSPYQNKNFAEIDLVCRIGGKLLLLECKGTKVKTGEIPSIFYWARRYEKDLKLLKQKAELLTLVMSKSGNLPPFLQGIQHTEVLLVRSEGIYGFPDTIPFRKLKEYLEKKI